MRKKLAIVSSYNTVCGNASYTHVLKEALSEHFETDVIAINHKLLGNAHPAAAEPKKAYLKEVAKQLEHYDYVNIQFESALYGHSLTESCVNVLSLIKACRSLLITFHRIPNPESGAPLWKVIIRNGVKIKPTLSFINGMAQQRAFAKFMGEIKRLSTAGRTIAGIVHTPREREILDFYYGFKDVVDFPITFLTKDQIATCLNNREEIRRKVFARYSFQEDAKYIGIFGFLSENKGHHVAVDALTYLPANYKLAIFGAQHPMGIKEYDLSAALKLPRLFRSSNNAYISSLVELASAINKSKIDLNNSLNTPDTAPVRFLGSLPDDEFIEAMTAMDFIVVPYFETGQGGSGNASLALEVEAKAIFSRTFAFMDLANYYPNCFEMTDIGNAAELAQQIYTWKKDLRPAQRSATARFCIENNALVHKDALENGATSAQRLKDTLTMAPNTRPC